MSSFALGQSFFEQETVSEQEIIPKKTMIEMDKLRSHLIGFRVCSIRALF
ncbi:MAG: hypothetical protein ACPGVB_09065 [Chitinophagales bacterium]